MLNKKTILFLLILSSIDLKAQNEFSIGYNLTNNYRNLSAKSEPYKSKVKKLDSSEISNIGHMGYVNYKIKLSNRISILTQVSYNSTEYKTKKKDGNVYDDATQMKIESKYWETYQYNFLGASLGGVFYSKSRNFSITPIISYQRLLKYYSKQDFSIPSYHANGTNIGYYDNDTSKVKNNFSLSLNLGYSLAALRLPYVSLNLRGEYNLNSINSSKHIKNHLWNVGLGLSMAIKQTTKKPN